MIYTDNTRKAMKIAFDAHMGQFDKSGVPYILHPIHLAEQMETEEECIVALLHDILEDTDCSEQELRNAGCDDDIIEAIKSVTRRKDEQYYFDFIKRANKNPIGRIVKIYDLENNMDVRRLSKFGDYEQKRLKKYWYSWKYLKGEITEKKAEKEINSYK